MIRSLLSLTIGMITYAATAAKPEPIVHKPKDQKGEVPVAVWLHGYRGFPGFIKEPYLQDLADKLGIAIVGFPGTTDLGDDTQQWSEEPPADHAYIQEQLRKLGRKHRFDLHRIGLFGFSQGAMVAADLCSRYPNDYMGAVIMSPGGITKPSAAEYPLPAHKRQRFWLLCGEEEHPGNVTLAKDYADQLRFLGSEVTSVFYPKVKEHTLPPDLREKLPEWMSGILRLNKSLRPPSGPKESALLGLWRLERAVMIDGKTKIAEGTGEMDFRANGVLYVTFVDPPAGTPKPIRMRGTYTFDAPDIVSYTFDGSLKERQEFAVTGDTATFRHLDYKRIVTLRRIQATQFREVPLDIDRLPINSSAGDEKSVK